MQFITIIATTLGWALLRSTLLPKHRTENWVDYLPWIALTISAVVSVLILVYYKVSLFSKFVCVITFVLWIMYGFYIII